MYNYNFYIVIMENCDITELYKLVWQFPYPMVTPVIGYKENKEIDWLIDWHPMYKENCVCDVQIMLIV